MMWTLPEIAKATGADYRTLKNWADAGLLTPSVRAPKGSGNTALYSDDDLITATILVAARPLLTLDGLRKLVTP